MSTLAAPVAGSLVPLASVAMTLRTQVERAGTVGYGIARGGPKKQLSTGWHELAVPPQSASVVQLASGLGPVQVPPVPQPVALKQVAPRCSWWRRRWSWSWWRWSTGSTLVDT